MQIREGNIKDFDELNAFYVRMNRAINERNGGFIPENAVYPSKDMIKSAISGGEQFVGIENGKIVAGAIVNNECEKERFKLFEKEI